MYIYKITNLINNKIYIGQTVRTIKQRFNEHCGNQNSTISNAIRKYGKENFKVEVINEFNTIDELNFFEEYYISLFNSLAPHGYNINTGGLNFQMHKITKEKLSKCRTGNKTFKATSKYLGVYYRERNKAFCFIIYSNGKVVKSLTSKSEKWCAYMYDQYCIKNNLPDYKLNNISYEEAYKDYRKFYDENNKLIKTQNIYPNIYLNKKNSKYYSVMLTVNKKLTYVGYSKDLKEAVNIRNQYIIDNKLKYSLII